MSIRRAAAILSIAAVALAACSGGGTPSSSTAASAAASAPASAAASAPASAAAASCHVGVSWPTFQEERYGLRDEPGLKGAVEAGGGTYTGNDAKLSSEAQAANVEALLAADVDVLVVDAQDPQAILPSIQKAVDAGIPVIAYDRELENSAALFMTHDSVEVGRMIATAVTTAQPTGNYAIIKGDKTQTNPLFLSQGFDEVTEAARQLRRDQDRGRGEHRRLEARDGPDPTMEQSSPPTHDIQAVLSQNDGMATGSSRRSTATPTARSRSAARTPTRRPSTASPWHAGRQRLEGLHRARPEGRRGRPRALQDPDITKVTGAVPTKTSAVSTALGPAQADPDHAGQPAGVLDANWLTEGRALQGRPGRDRRRLRRSPLIPLAAGPASRSP